MLKEIINQWDRKVYEDFEGVPVLYPQNGTKCSPLSTPVVSVFTYFHSRPNAIIIHCTQYINLHYNNNSIYSF